LAQSTAYLADFCAEIILTYLPHSQKHFAFDFRLKAENYVQ